MSGTSQFLSSKSMHHLARLLNHYCRLFATKKSADSYRISNAGNNTLFSSNNIPNKQQKTIKRG